MKLLSLLFLTIFMARGCEKNPKQDIDTAVIEYVANSRGFYQKITIEKNTVKILDDRKGKPIEIEISDADCKILASIFKKINLDEIKNLKSPTEKRFYDGAAIAQLKITYKGNVYESQHFDHGYPPNEIKELVTKINSFAKKNNDN